MKEDVDALKKQLFAQLKELHEMYHRGEATLADTLRIYPEELESVYASALTLLQQQKPQKAVQVLGNLCMLQPYDARYWRTFGLALSQIKRAPLAMAAWQLALTIDKEDIPSLTYRGEQYILLGKKVNAADDLNAVLRLAKASDKAAQPFVQRAKGLLRFAQASA